MTGGRDRRQDGAVWVMAGSFGWRAWAQWAEDQRFGDISAIVEFGDDGRRGGWFPGRFPPGDFDSIPADHARARRFLRWAFRAAEGGATPRGVVRNFDPDRGTGAG